MPAYVVVRSAVSNMEQYKQYVAASTGAAPKFGGRFVVRGGKTVTLEGPEETRRVVILEFPSLKQAEAWYHSEEYQTARALRAGAAVAEFLAVEGI